MSPRIAAIVVNRNQPDITNDLCEQILAMADVDIDLLVIEAGSDQDKRSRYESFWYFDKDFSGKCLAHNMGLSFANGIGNYDYYWFLMNDLQFDDKLAAAKLVDCLAANPRMGIISPTEQESVNNFAESKPRPGGGWHRVSTCDYLCLMMPSKCVRDIGFLNPSFRYSWGAIHELSFRLYSSGWFIAYNDDVQMVHLGGTTYGKSKNAPSRSEYISKAKAWAAEYFVTNYGESWDDLFTSVLPEDIETNSYKLHRKSWEEELNRPESSQVPKLLRTFRKALTKRFAR